MDSIAAGKAIFFWANRLVFKKNQEGKASREHGFKFHIIYIFLNIRKKIDIPFIKIRF